MNAMALPAAISQHECSAVLAGATEKSQCDIPCQKREDRTKTEVCLSGASQNSSRLE